MRIYLAATYGQMLEMRNIASKLRDAGHEITARWIDGKEEGQTKGFGARMDIADIDYADTIISFTLAPHTLHTGGGRHFEMGYAYCAGKRTIIIGLKGEHIFHFLPSVEHYETLDDLLKVEQVLKAD